MTGLHLVVFGRPGSGKGTQCSLLAERLGLVHLSSGDLLRDAFRRGTPLGRQAAAVMRSGELLPDELVVEIVMARMDEVGAFQHGVVLDGFPRTVSQAALLEEALAPVGVDLALELDVPVDLVQRRIEQRRAVGREDDDPCVVDRRLAVHERETVPVVEWYAAGGKLAVVDGVGPVNAVTARILDAIAVERRVLTG